LATTVLSAMLNNFLTCQTKMSVTFERPTMTVLCTL